MMTTIPTPQDIARRLPRNSGEKGDTITYRNSLGLREDMLVEDVCGAAGGVHVVYLGSAHRVIHSRLVIEVRHA